MRTSFRLAALLLMACAVPLAAQGVFVVTDVRADGVVVSPVDTGARKLSEITAGFTRFDLFDVYAARGTDSYLTDFVDSLSYDSTTTEGVLLRYVWKGENKFMKRGFFAVRTGRIYVTGEDETVSKARVSTAPTGGVRGSFGAPGLTFAAGVGGGIIQDLTTPEAMTGAAMISAKLWYRFIGVSLRAGLPLSTPIQLDNVMASAFLDLGYDPLPFWTVFISFGYSLGPNSGLAACAGTHFLLPLFGDTSVMPYLEAVVVAPTFSAPMWGIVSVGLKL